MPEQEFRNYDICLAHLHRLLSLLEYYGKTLPVSPAADCSILRERWQLFTPSHFLTVLFPRCILFESVPGTFSHAILCFFYSPCTRTFSPVGHPSFRFLSKLFFECQGQKDTESDSWQTKTNTLSSSSSRSCHGKWDVVQAAPCVQGASVLIGLQIAAGRLLKKLLSVWHRYATLVV